MPSLSLVILSLSLLFHVPLTNAISPDDLSAVESWLSENAEANLQKFIQFASIPSVSSDPNRASEVRRCANWLKAELSIAGLDNARLIETKGQPTVYADWLHARQSGVPTILFYGHYDVQPEDPVHLWTSPPFEPTIRDGKLYARGASDDKGGVWSTVVSIKAWLKAVGKMPVNIRLLFEGEEEVGSPYLKDMIAANAKLFKADYAFSVDGGMVSPEIPSFTMSLRGVFTMEVSLKVAESDMHSGAYGGGVQNPIHVLVELLSGLRDMETGRISVDGFYDEVDDVTEEEKKWAREYPVDVGEELKREGVSESTGEKGYNFYERTWYRPTVEVVGIWGGFTGKGIKTVLPREAHAKLAARIVMSQNPMTTQALVQQHLERAAAKMAGVSIKVRTTPFNAEAFKSSKEASGNKVAAKVLTELYGRDPVYRGMGGTIPVMCILRQLLGLETTMFAFAHGDENVHAPNEYGRIDSYRRGEIAYVRLFYELAKEHGVLEDMSSGEDVMDEKDDL